MIHATFSSELKNADVIPVFKKKDRNNVENYRPVSILPNLSKINERCPYNKMYKYFNHILSKWQCGFRKSFSTQHCHNLLFNVSNTSLSGSQFSIQLTRKNKIFFSRYSEILYEVPQGSVLGIYICDIFLKYPV